MLRIPLLVGGVLAMVAMAWYVGTGSIGSALARVTAWQLIVLCVIYAVNIIIDTWAWQLTLPRGGAPFGILLAARGASEASNALSVVAVGEAMKAWLVEFEIPYKESVPSLVLAKTAEVIAQALFLAFGLTVAIFSGLGDAQVRAAIGYMLAFELIGVGGFVVVQIAGVVGGLGRLLSWVGINWSDETQQLSNALRGFYRDDWRRFLLSTTLHFLGSLLAIIDGFVVLYSLGLNPSFAMATLIEALWSGVRFATFFIPGGLGSLEAADTAAFPALGLAASEGMAFTLVRRARQIVWIAVGLVILVAMRAARKVAQKPAKSIQRAPAEMPHATDRRCADIRSG